MTPSATLDSLIESELSAGNAHKALQLRDVRAELDRLTRGRDTAVNGLIASLEINLQMLPLIRLGVQS